MRIHYLQHEPGEDIGNMRPWFEARNWPITSTQLHLGESLPELEAFDWLVIMGGPMSAYDDERVPWLVAEKTFIRAAVDAQKTVIGICLGAQLLAAVLGGRVFRASRQEIGWFEIRRDPQCGVNWLPERAELLSWHGDTFTLPPGAERLASSVLTENQGFRWGERVVALQFHLEAWASTPEIFRCASGSLPEPDEFVQGWPALQGTPAHFTAGAVIMGKLLTTLAEPEQG